MAVRKEVSEEDEAVAVPLIIMTAAAYLMPEVADERRAIVDEVWPSAVHRHALEMGARAVYALCLQLGIEAEVVTTLGAALLTDDTKDN